MSKEAQKLPTSESLAIGAFVSELRRGCRLSQREFSKSIGTDAAVISRMENGLLVPHRAMIEKIGEVYQLPESSITTLQLLGGNFTEELSSAHLNILARFLVRARSNPEMWDQMANSGKSPLVAPMQRLWRKPFS